MISPKYKRADVELQFNWIFILIAGAVILLVFFGVTQSLRKGSQENIELDVGTDLRTALIGIKVGKSSTTIPIPTVGMALGCDGLKVGSLQSLRLGPTFGPKQIQGNFLQAWSHDWSAPMQLDNFLYLSSARVKYLFVEDSAGLMRELVESLPSVNGKLVEDCEALEAELPSTTLELKVVQFDLSGGSFTDVCDLPDSFLGRREATSNVVIAPSSAIILDEALQRGDLYIADLRTLSAGEEPSYFRRAYIGEAPVYGAIFSTDPAQFDCMYYLALGNAAMILQNYITRLELISQTQIDTSCRSEYTASISSGGNGELHELKTIFEQIANKECGHEGQDPCRDFYLYIDELENRNQKLQELSCPSIY